jgi:hypothetical protein
MDSSRCSSQRSMEILSPEPVAGELNIELSDSEEENEKNKKTKQKKRENRENKKCTSRPIYKRIKSPTRSAMFKAENEVEAACEAEEKLEKGFQLIKNNDLKLKEMNTNLTEIRKETENIRRENAKYFHLYKNKLGTGGNRLLQKLYFHDYPSLEATEAELESNLRRLMLDYDSDKLENLTDHEINEICSNEKIFATEVDEFNEPDVRPEVTQLDRKNKRAISPKRENSEELALGDSTNSKKEKSIIKRNIELAATGDVLTAEERKRINSILETIDELEEEKNEFRRHQNRLNQIDNQLESDYPTSYSKSTGAFEYKSDNYKFELDRIDSRLENLENEKIQIPQKSLSITNDSSLIPSLLPRKDIDALIKTLSNKNEKEASDYRSNLSNEELKLLLDDARNELNL